jgi:hypothetical protein
VDSYPGPLFCSTGLHVCFCTSTMQFLLTPYLSKVFLLLLLLSLKSWNALNYFFYWLAMNLNLRGHLFNEVSGTLLELGH